MFDQINLDAAIALTRAWSRSASMTISAAHRIRETKLLSEPRILDQFEQQLITAFVTSTNVAQVYPEAEEFYYAGRFDPYKNTCNNQLSATFLA